MKEAAGHRFIISKEGLSFSDLSYLLRLKYEKQGFDIPTIQANDYFFYFIAHFNSTYIHCFLFCSPFFWWLFCFLFHI